MGKYLQLAEQALLKESGVSVNEGKNQESGAKRQSPPKSYGEKSELCELRPDNGTETVKRPDWSKSPLVKSVDEWSKRLQESPDELRRAAGDDWEEMSADIIGFADALAVYQIRESGAIPSSYTSETFCRKCNCYVPFYEGVPEIGSCSWCRNGQTPPPMPDVKE